MSMEEIYIANQPDPEPDNNQFLLRNFANAKVSRALHVASFTPLLTQHLCAAPKIVHTTRARPCHEHRCVSVAARYLKRTVRNTYGRVGRLVRVQCTNYKDWISVRIAWLGCWSTYYCVRDSLFRAHTGARVWKVLLFSCARLFSHVFVCVSLLSLGA